MENKIRREARRFLEKQFKKYDPCMTGAIEVKHMVKIVKELLKEDPHLYSEEEIYLQIQKHAKESTFISVRRDSKEFILLHEEGRLEFPAVMDITVYFLKKQEKMNNDSFAFKHMIRLNDFPNKKPAA